MSLFDPVDPLATMVPWGVPQTLTQRPRDDENRGHPIVGERGRYVGDAAGANMSQPGAPFQPFQIPDSIRISDIWRRAIINGQITAPVNLTSTLVLQQSDVFRNLLLIRNNSGAANVFLNFGNDAATNSSVIVLGPGGFVGFDTVVPQDDIFAIADAAGGTIAIAFSTTAYLQGVK